MASVLEAVRRIGLFPRLPFLTDAEMADLFGPEVEEALRRLDGVNTSGGICRECAGLCCSQMRCEIYAAEFGRCPIRQFRPVLCRFNYCHRYGKEHEDAAKTLIQVAVDTVAALPAGTAAAAAFNLNALLYGECQGAGDVLPGAVTDLRAIMDEARAGRLGWTEAECRLSSYVRAYRGAPSCT